jgi:four helix bundle protein
MEKRVFDLEERLINFSVQVLDLAEQLPNTYAGKHLAGQLIRSGTAPALNYGEAQGAESRNDFIHKMKVCLKELRETQICLKIIQRKPMLESEDLESIIGECNQLVAIFTSSVKKAAETAKPKDVKPQNRKM